MLVISQTLVAALKAAGEKPNSPLIGADSLVTTSNVTASSAHVDHPVSNLANSMTDLRWRATGSGEQTLTATIDSEQQIDYVGLFGRNLKGRGILVEGDDGGGYDELGEQQPADDKPLLFRYAKQSLQAVRITFAAGSSPVDVSVLRIGTLVVVPRHVGVGHAPISYAREPEIVNAVGGGGDFLGEVNIGGTRRTTIELRNLDPAWYRASLDPIVAARTPFFWVGRPTDYPLECGYVWLTGAPKPVNQRPNGMMSIALPVEGIA